MDFDLVSPASSLKDIQLIIIKEKIKNPNITLKELSQILRREYNKKLSHTRIAEILKHIKETGIMREVLLLNEKYFIFAFVEIDFELSPKKEHKEMLGYLVNSPHVVMFLTTDSRYRWKLLTAFRSFQELNDWVEELMETQGKLIKDVKIAIVYRIAKFVFPHQLLDGLIKKTPESSD